MTDHVTIAGRELFYLARVGAFRYLDAAYGALRVRASVVPPSPPPDTGLMPCGCEKCRLGPGEKRQGHDLAAFIGYAAAERLALAHLGQLTDPAELERVCKRLGDGIAEGERTRAELLRTGRPVPGRRQWLVPVDTEQRQPPAKTPRADRRARGT